MLMLHWACIWTKDSLFLVTISIDFLSQKIVKMKQNDMVMSKPSMHELFCGLSAKSSSSSVSGQVVIILFRLSCDRWRELHEQQNFQTTVLPAISYVINTVV